MFGSRRDVTRPLSVRQQSADGALVDVGKRPALSRYLRDFWDRRAFAMRMSIEEVRTEHLNTALGNLWHLLNPILLTLTYYLVFGVVLSVDRGQDNFITFLTIGVFAFHYTQKSVNAGARSITSNRGLLRSIAFPRAILPLSSVVSQTIALGPVIAVMLGVALVTGEVPSLAWLMIVPLFAGQALFNLGISLGVARLTARYRDFENLLAFVFRILFYASGVLYPVTRWVAEDSPLRSFFDWNPVYAYITLLRGAILGTEVNTTIVASAALWTMLFLVAGFWYFLRGEQEYGRD